MHHIPTVRDFRLNRIALILSVLFVLAGCSNVFYPSAEQEAILHQEDGNGYSIRKDEKGTTIWGAEHGILSVSTGLEFPDLAEHAILSYMERYYKTAASLEMVKPDDLFSDSENSNLELNKNAWEYLIGLRSMQRTDLRLSGYHYELLAEDTRLQKDGSFFVSLNENCVQQFAEHPDVDSEFYNIQHIFVLVQQDGSWKIQEHLQSDGIYINIAGKYWNDDLSLLLEKSKEIPDAAEFFASQKDSILKLSREQMELRISSTGIVTLPETDHEYDRDAAVSYSDNWIGKRNESWSDFTGQGGNCQNYVSQSLYAGGIPMDVSGRALWSWGLPNPYLSEDGENSMSWINTESFRQYAAFNNGYGLVALTDVPYLEGEKGDVIQMGLTNWPSHTVLISKVITDDNGNTVDYLVNSNTADLKNFPVSAYTLPNQTLTKILGWNEQ